MKQRGASFFPHPSSADSTGLVAVTDEMHPDLLLDAYRHGIFPWSESPVRWYSPDPRTIFLPDRVHLPRNLPRLARKARFQVSFDRAFAEVLEGCAEAHRDDGVWITESFRECYNELHQMGYAHSVEIWQDGKLAGGLYGVQVGGLFAGESMFYRVSNASKVAFAALLGQLDHIGTVLFDAQVINHHTARLGAVLIHRSDYLQLLEYALKAPVLYARKKWPSSPTFCI